MKIFKEHRQGQNFLLPPSLDEFVPEDHEVRIISDVVDTLDASLLLGRYEGGGAVSNSPANCAPHRNPSGPSYPLYPENASVTFKLIYKRNVCYLLPSN